MKEKGRLRKFLDFLREGDAEIMGRYWKIALLAAGLACIWILGGGCSLKTGDSLLSLPKVPAEYVQLQQQLDVILQGGAAYAVAESGTNRQAVQEVDLDGDGHEEVLAFFRTESGSFQVYGFRREKDEYLPMGMAEGYGTALQAIYYPQLGNGTRALAVCWGFDEGGSYGMTVYGFSKGGMTVLLDMQYADVAFSDLDGDGAEELAFAVRDSVSGSYTARVYRMGKAGYQVSWEAPMCIEVRSVANMQFGQLEEGRIGLYIDSIAIAGGYVTDLICYDGRQAVNRTMDPASGSGGRTWRSSSVFCSDISGDGQIDVPVNHSFPYDANENESRYRLDWMNYDPMGDEIQVSSTYHVPGESWYLAWPESWGDQVRAERISGMHYSRTKFFHLRQEGKTEEVMSIYLFTGSSRESQADLYRQLQPLASTSAGIYRCGVIEGEDPELFLPLEAVKTLFHTIEISWHGEAF